MIKLHNEKKNCKNLHHKLDVNHLGHDLSSTKKNDIGMITCKCNLKIYHIGMITCKKCNLKIYHSIFTNKYSTFNPNDACCQTYPELDLTCNEMIIKNIIE